MRLALSIEKLLNIFKSNEHTTVTPPCGIKQLPNAQDEPKTNDVPSTSTETIPENASSTTNNYQSSHSEEPLNPENNDAHVNNEVSDGEEAEEQEGSLSEISILVATSIVKCCLEQLCKLKSDCVFNIKLHKYV